MTSPVLFQQTDTCAPSIDAASQARPSWQPWMFFEEFSAGEPIHQFHAKSALAVVTAASARAAAKSSFFMSV